MHSTVLIACRTGLFFLALGSVGWGQVASGAEGQPAATRIDVQPIKIHPGYRISCQAMNGKKFGVATLLIEDIPLNDEAWALDQVAQIRSDSCQIWFPTRSVVTPSEGQSTAEIYFIFHDGFPNTIDLSLSGQLVRQNIPVVAGLAGVSYENAVSRWWSLFCQQSVELAPNELTQTNRDLLAALGQLFERGPEYLLLRDAKAGSQLENEFERTLGMLLGFESVRLAMMTDEPEGQADASPARLQLPQSMNVAGLRLPVSAKQNAGTLPITNLVPQDCYFVRCQSLENYLWLRGLLVDWGGSINELVSSRVIASDVRARLEKQLALKAEALLAAGVDATLEDMAVIGSDVLFEQGAGVGVLFHARPGHVHKLANTIQSERQATAVRPQLLKLEGVDVSLLATADNQVRSYFVQIGDFLLLTNSSHIARSVILAQSSGTSLGNLAEFTYALATNPHGADARILFYLSDPFFRRLVSAPFRIELSRRRAAEHDCRRIETAALIAEATGHKVTDKASLVKCSVLPREFGTRSDGSTVDLRDGKSYDTLRGSPGTFLPVVDIDIKNCNEAEKWAYATFSAKYRQEWRVMDPVLASLDAVAVDSIQERLHLSVHITPYARQQYQFLTQFLGAPTRTYLSAGELAAWLNHWTVGLKTNPKEFRRVIELTSGGELVCPLGGQWKLEKKAPELPAIWISSSWREPSLCKVNGVPDDFRFAFLDWFRGLQLRFSLRNDSLESDIFVNYQPSPDRNPYRLRIADQEKIAVPDQISKPLMASPFGSEQNGIPQSKALPEREPLDSSPNAQLSNESERPVLESKAARPAEIGIRINPSTMVVSQVKPGKPASLTDLQIGDRILKVNGAPIDTLQRLRQRIAIAAKSTELVVLAIDRQGRELEIEIKLGLSADVDL